VGSYGLHGRRHCGRERTFIAQKAWFLRFILADGLVVVLGDALAGTLLLAYCGAFAFLRTARDFAARDTLQRLALPCRLLQRYYMPPGCPPGLHRKPDLPARTGGSRA